MNTNKDVLLIDEEINLYELFLALWNRKVLIISLTLIAAVISVTYSLSIENTYRSQVLLVQSDSKTGGLASSLGGLSGLAGIAGITLPTSSGSGRKQEAIAVLNSHQFLESFIIRHDLLVSIMAGTAWNKDNNKLVINPKIYDEVNNKWITNSKKPSKPSLQEAVRNLRTLLGVATDKKNGYLTIYVDSFSPHVSKQWVDWLVQDINAYMRNDEVTKSERSLIYLNKQLNKTSISEIKNVLSQLIKSETQTIMLSESSSEYMFKTIDKAIVPELKLGPRRSIICIVGTLIGFFLSLMIALLHVYFRPTMQTA